MMPELDEGDRRERFRCIYRAEYPRIVGYALRRTRSPEDAADVATETFLTAWRRLDDLSSDDEARLWLYAIARRILANHHRGARRSSQLLERLRHQVARSVESFVPEPERIDTVRQALIGLREQDREILGLVAWEGLTGQELARVLGCSPNAAKIRLHRARRRLARRIVLEDSEMKPEMGPGHEPGRRTSARQRNREAT
jgi:RNA polymerase sigma factor (sigma-70 family)